MSIAIFLCLTTVITAGWKLKLGQQYLISGNGHGRFQPL